uniref:Uncharacterized protein n=1 Tax=Candidatus Kentrum sp. UNK TaxID=2126344 RepID=A0A451AAR4_9GAMM|nr:MAG: hypothetical protein BECKUNK1418G_GA0071005_10302 [Candidatus Kentron sp. UNK]
MSALRAWTEAGVGSGTYAYAGSPTDFFEEAKSFTYDTSLCCIQAWRDIGYFVSVVFSYF